MWLGLGFFFPLGKVIDTLVGFEGLLGSSQYVLRRRLLGGELGLEGVYGVLEVLGKRIAILFFQIL